MRVEKQVLSRELSIALDRIKELEEENQVLSKELSSSNDRIKELEEENQKLRLALYGIKKTRNKGKRGSNEGSKGEPKKLGPPKGHKGTELKMPDRVDRTIYLKIEECPHCKGELSERTSVRESFGYQVYHQTGVLQRLWKGCLSRSSRSYRQLPLWSELSTLRYLPQVCYELAP